MENTTDMVEIKEFILELEFALQGLRIWADHSGLAHSLKFLNVRGFYDKPYFN